MEIQRASAQESIPMEMPSIWSLISEEEREALQAEVRSRWQQRLARFPERTLLWLALMPFSTVALAEACAFPVDKESEHVQALFARLFEEGLCELKQAGPNLILEDERVLLQPTADTDNYFSLTEAVRADLLQRIQRDAAQGTARLLHELEFLGQAILNAKQRGVSVPPLLARWADLASAASSAAAVTRRFSHEIEALLATDQLNELLRWIEAARPLIEVLEGDLAAAVEQASRQMELHHRRSYDEQYLAHFLEREEQIAAFNRLLDKKNTSAWALHFIGPGGIGKTMLMRYITARLVKERGASVARVDFDYLNPGYPSRAPALLLDQFAQELRLQGNALSDKEFDQFARKVTNFYEQFTGALASGASIIQTLGDAEFVGLLRTFARALNNLPQPVVLILDTCEELAKIRPDGVIPENVRATFQILEQLHRMLPGVRVIFSGRRPLASSGAGGWTCPTSAHSRRPYLLLHEIQGFTRDEALRYLRDHMQVRAQLVEPVLEKSLDTDQVELFTFARRARRQTNSLSKTRYNPFDLSLYAGWANADSTLTAEALRTADVDRYIERRIVGRITHPGLLSLLPAVSLLGHFDRETLRVISQSSEESFSTIFQELLNQEWIQLQQYTFWKVKSSLRERLYAYYRKHDPVALGEARQRVLPYLERITQEWPLDRLNISHFDVALRLLEESDPRRAAVWWEKIETRFASEPNAYGWVISLIEQLKGEEGALAEIETGSEAVDAESRRESALRAAVLATYAAAQLHTIPSLTAERAATWQEVALKSERHPTAVGRERLRLRASAALSMLEKNVEQLFRLLEAAFQKERDEQTIAALVAALESLLEEREPVPQEISFQETPRQYEETFSPTHQELLSWEPLLVFVDQLDSVQLSLELRTFALVLAARACRLAEDWHRMEHYFVRALAREPQLRANLQCWLDWRAPENLAARVQLEYIRAFYPALYSPQEVLERVNGANFADHDWKSDLDSNRLQTALLQLRGTQSPPVQVISERTVFLHAGLTDVEDGFGLEPHCNAHRAFQPFCCAIAEELARLGKVEQALSELQELSRSAEQTAVDQDIVYAVEYTILRIVRRMRLRDEGYKPGPDFPRHNEEWTLDGLSGPRIEPAALAEVSRRISSRFISDFAGEKESGALLCHARWRTSYTLRLDWAMGALSSQMALIEMLLSAQGQPEDASFATLSLFLDALEVNEVTTSIGIPPVLPTLAAAQLDEIRENWFAAHQDQPVEALTLALRAAALGRKRSDIPQFSGALVRRVGVRRAAQIALDEGELLALRLPERAIPLLNQAWIWFAAAQDSLSQFISTITLALAQARLGNRDQVRDLLRSHFGQQYFAQIPALFSQVLADLQFNFQREPPLHSQEEHVAARALLSEQTLFERMVKEMAAGHGGFAGVDSLSRAWRPWLIRLLACAIWSDDRQTDMRDLALWLESHYSLTLLQTTEPVYGEKVLPAELDGWPEWPGEQASLVRHPQADQPEITQFNQTRGIRTDNGVIVLSFSSKEGQSNIRRGALEVTMAVASSLGGVVGSPIISSLASAALTSLVSTVVSYVQSARRNSELKKMVELIPPTRPVTLELRVDEASSAICWEGLITSALEETGSQRIDFQQLQFYRTMPKLPTWPARVPRKISEIEAAGSSSDALALQNAIWQELAKDEERFSVRVFDIEQLFFARQKLSLQKTDVLHLVAPVIETGSGGLGIELGPGYERQTSSGSRSRGRLWHAEELVHSFPNLTFCIVQAPLATMTRRSETDREYAAVQRRFAAQLFMHGIPIVLTIPAFPYDVGEQVIHSFSEVLRSRNVPSIATLLAALARARDSIVEKGSSWRREDALEMAWDVSLFVAREEKEPVND
jgi:hypothetical protein